MRTFFTASRARLRRQAGPCPAGSQGRTRKSPGGIASRSKGTGQARAGSRHGDAPNPGRQPAAPYGRRPTGRGAASGRHPRTRGQPVPAPTRHRWPRVHDLTGPPSPRRAFCRRTKIAVKGAPGGRVLGASLRCAPGRPLTVIFHGKIRRQSGGRTGLDSPRHVQGMAPPQVPARVLVCGGELRR